MRPLWLGCLLLALAGCGDAPELVLLLSVDTLRADHVGVYAKDPGLTENIDALARSAYVFYNAYTPVPFTLPAVASIYTGRYPSELGVTNNRVAMSARFPTLAQRLKAEGFRTGGVVSNFVIRAETGLAAGFDHYNDHYPQVEANRPEIPERTARFTTNAALETLDQLLANGGRRIFLWVHYQDPHGPYLPPGGLREDDLVSEQRAPDAARQLAKSADHLGYGKIPSYQYIHGEHTPPFYRAGYKGEIRHVDREIGRLHDGLRERGLANAMTLIFTADHGETMGEEDHWFSHGELLNDSAVRVPLFIRVPGRDGGPRDDVASLTDIYTTVLPLIGVDVEGYPGRNLLAPGEEAQSTTVLLANLKSRRLTRLGIIRDGFKYVLAAKDGLVVSQSLSLVADERTELADADEARTTGFRNALFQLAERHSPKTEAVAQELSSEDEERLLALGYADE